MAAFDQAFAIVIGTEGGFQSQPTDPGNWTGGKVGAGSLIGTNWGISAASYPTMNIAALTQAQAKMIYKRDYWDKVSGDLLPPPLALLAFDSAVNSGVARAADWLQTAVGATVDGDIGKATLAAVTAKAGDGAALMASLMAQRMVFDASLPTWKVYGAGWAQRLAMLPYQAMTMTA